MNEILKACERVASHVNVFLGDTQHAKDLRLLVEYVRAREVYESAVQDEQPIFDIEPAID